MWNNLPFWGFDYRGDWWWWWEQRWLPPLPHIVSVCTVPPSDEVYTLDEAKLRAGFTWPSPDERDALMDSFIRAARAKVESDTGLALLTQTREVQGKVNRIHFKSLGGILALQERIGETCVKQWEALPKAAPRAGP